MTTTSGAPALAWGLLDAARLRGDTILLEPDGFPLLQRLGIATPRFVAVSTPEDLHPAELRALDSDRVVVKIASTSVLHRTEVGGVAVVPNHYEVVRHTIEAMAARVPAEGLRGFTVSRFEPHDTAPGSELLVSLRWTDEFGPLVTIGPGGVAAELLARHLRPGDDVVVVAAEGIDRGRLADRLARFPLTRLVTGGFRRQPARVTLGEICDVVERLAALGRECSPALVTECEINPLAVTPGGLVALDVLVRLGTGAAPAVEPRPLEKLPRLLTPRSVAIVGVSEQMNPGRIILRNLLREGFPRDAIHVVKPGAAEIDGCRTADSLAALPAPVDLLVLAVGAAVVPGLLIDAIENRRAESVIVIPGGLEEKAGGAARLAPVREALARARRSPWRGPLVNGGNCLGIRSLPGRYDTLFIPPYKMPPRPAAVAPVAIVAQSGAFAVARASKLGRLNPKYVITVGNQMDLTVGDYLTALADDESIRIFGVYVEGFRPLDGLRAVEAVRRITAAGRIVVIYRAGRTPAGAAASATHTASMAGDYVATRELAREAGAIVAASLSEFEDVLRVAAALDRRRPAGPHLGAVSNAGFECVAMADNLGELALAAFAPGTRERLCALLESARLGSVVDVHNPLDLTPMAGDETFAAAVQAVLEDPGVEIGLVGCVPLTPALQTLPPGPGHGEDVGREASVGSRLVRLAAEIPKPWVAVVDAGRQYDPMVDVLEAGGVVTFRTADRALWALNQLWKAAGRGGRAVLPAPPGEPGESST
jgi:acyl-CoA synthetase (NDP forming)